MTKTTDKAAAADSAEAASDKPAPARRARRMARQSNPAEADPAVRPESPVQRGPSKIDRVLALLRSEGGATLAEMVEATGWLPHTTRAALTGLRKKGHVLTKDKRGEVTCYRIEVAS